MDAFSLEETMSFLLMQMALQISIHLRKSLMAAKRMQRTVYHVQLVQDMRRAPMLTVQRFADSYLGA